MCARRVSHDVERELDFILELEQAAGDGDRADVEIGQPQRESALRAQFISLKLNHRVNRELSRHSAQRQIADDLYVVSAFTRLARRDGRALKNDLRVTNRFEQFFAR